ncbi:inositol hexakisphosphate-domain-containing protein [Phakopsora pachyrhizi]|uniref:Inositol hexakisphosphate-domain-containing protein n=1 Tax=Phakopsora pachyrhizi TaxID=170000 RepID=A0AAV0AFJ0_PHAPC|nr:inositol hexakisphosphate-domain-containing protein [Phakopsora pachyrhizi]
MVRGSRNDEDGDQVKRGVISQIDDPVDRQEVVDRSSTGKDHSGNRLDRTTPPPPPPPPTSTVNSHEGQQRPTVDRSTQISDRFNKSSHRFKSISSIQPVIKRPRPSLSPHSRLIHNSINTINQSDQQPHPEQAPDPDQFHRLAVGVVNSRQGSVLGRGSLLKTDHWASGRAKSLTHHLQGSPNFRSSAYNIFGTAQPTVSGIKTVLGFLKSNPVGRCKSVWFCTREEPVIYLSSRPFVLRDSLRPDHSSSTISDRAENIEAIENRLKLDILKESSKYGGLILVHDETVEGEILPTWSTADDVKTAREVWEEIKNEGYHVDYHRVPISHDQAPEDSYLDKYLTILRTIPTTTSLIFNCGMGVIRTTFAMSAAIIMRRRQILKEGGQDLFGIEINDSEHSSRDSGNTGSNAFGTFRGIGALRMVGEQQIRTRSLLKLMQLLQRCLPTANQHTVMELLTSQPTLLENLRKGASGEFDIIMSLVSILDRGNKEKDLVDMVIDHCDEVINLRDNILEHRIQFALSASPTEQNNNNDIESSEKTENHLKCALASLERYFFLIAFSGYCNEPPMSFKENFSTWLKSRSEISNMILRLRRTARQFIFAPLHDLTLLFRSNVGKIVSTTEMRLKFENLERAGGEVVGSEWAHHIVDTRRGIILRSGLILKSDQWPAQFDKDDKQIKGALNFRKVPESDLFGLSQPTQDGIDRVVDHITHSINSNNKFPKTTKNRLTWINLREEPLIYINGIPYVLRLEAVGLRNIKSYAGISSARLELLEDRLKSDILAELRSFGGRILLHIETDDGSIVGVWESTTPDSVQTLKEIMEQKSKSVLENGNYKLDFKRQPITAEKAPDFEDVKDLIEIVSEVEKDSPFIVNCQLGRGRSTLTMVCILLIQSWLSHGGGRFAFAEINQEKIGLSSNGRRGKWSYQTINNLLRVMRNGGGIKAAVDGAIEKCSAVYDLIGSIEVCRVAAEESGDDLAAKEQQTKKGISNLRRYAFVLIFACYLNETIADTWRELKNNRSFESFWKNHQVFKTILDELNGGDLQALMPLEQQLGDRSSLLSHGIDWTEEEKIAVASRSGIILSAQTILKSDFFVGLQKMALPLRIDGLPNIRQVPLNLDSNLNSNNQSIFGSGMPTVDGLRKGLEMMGSIGKQPRMVYWTSMREEPVLYVSGRPHVLRLFDQPLENVVTTGVSAAAVEGMESALKLDVLNELRSHDGRLLLHDEVEENGKFIVTAVWETPKEGDIMTPREVFDLMKSEGFKVDYARLPVTDEQAPIPGVFSRLEKRVSDALRLNKDSDIEDEYNSLGSHLVFNCQMGRGRTTTGMVAATLVANILRLRKKKDGRRLSVSSIVSDEAAPFGSNPLASPGGETNVGGDTWDVAEVNPYLEGEYKIILQLVSVLQHGRLAKKLTDMAIDAMDSVQNLRKSVYDFKLRAEAASPESEKRTKILNVALNYLFRYGSLITFSNWLLEKCENESIYKKKRNKEDRGDGVGLVDEGDKSEFNRSQNFSFHEWLNEHGEVQHILKKRSLD